MKRRKIDFIVHVKTPLSPEQQNEFSKKLEDIENIFVICGCDSDIEIKTLSDNKTI